MNEGHINQKSQQSCAMGITPVTKVDVAPKAVSSTSSMETAASLYQEVPYAEKGALETVPSHAPVSHSRESRPSEHPAQHHHFSAYNPVCQNSSGTAQSIAPSISLMPRPAQVPISPSKGVGVSPNVSVPEFLYQLTKMLTDNNRDVIEWSDGKFDLLSCF